MNIKPFIYMTCGLVAIVAGQAFAKTYKWVDAEGVTHYSDQDHPGAEKIEIKLIDTVKITPVAPMQKRNNTDEDGELVEQIKKKTTYEKAEFNTPQPEQTFQNIGGKLNISLALTPALDPEHTIELLLDGEVVPYWSKRQTSGTLVDVFRGEHTLSFRVLDKTKSPIKSSSSVRFFVLQASINNPVNPVNR